MRKSLFKAACGLPLLLCLSASATTLDRALLFAEAWSAELSASDRQIEALGNLADTALQLPDPKLKLGLENVPVGGNNARRLTREGMTMQRVAIMQQYVSRTKRERKAATMLAEARQAAAGKNAIRARLQRETALAWVDLALSEKTLALIQKLQTEISRQIKAQTAALANQSVSADSVLESRLALKNIENEADKARRDIATAQAELLRLTGKNITTTSGAFPPVARLPAEKNLLLESVKDHPDILQAALAAESAKAKSGQSAVAAIPDPGIEVYYARRGDGYEDMAGVMLSMDLPLFQSKRQDKDHAADLSRAFQANDQLALMIRARQAELHALLSRYEAAHAIYQRQQEEVIPLVRQKAALAEAQYRNGGGLAGALTARRELLNAEIAANTAKKALAEAWIAIRYLIPQEVTL